MIEQRIKTKTSVLKIQVVKQTGILLYFLSIYKLYLIFRVSLMNTVRPTACIITSYLLILNFLPVVQTFTLFIF